MRTSCNTSRWSRLALLLLDRIQFAPRKLALSGQLSTPIPRLVWGELTPLEFRTGKFACYRLRDFFIAFPFAEVLCDARRD